MFLDFDFVLNHCLLSELTACSIVPFDGYPGKLRRDRLAVVR